MDCPPGDNKVAIVVERWPLQEVWLYFSKYCVVVLFSCLHNSFPSIRTGRLSWSSRRDFSKQRLNKFSYMLMLIKHPYKFDMLGIPVYAHDYHCWVLSVKILCECSLWYSTQTVLCTICIVVNDYLFSNRISLQSVVLGAKLQ